MLQTILMASSEPVEQTNAVDFNSILEGINESVFGSLAEFIGNVSIYIPLIVFVGICVVLLLTFKCRIYQINNVLIDSMSKNGKYIKGLFVELNETKELLRYSVNEHKWKKRIVKDYNCLFDDELGKMLRIIYKSYNVDFGVKKNITVDKLYEKISTTLELMKKIRSRKCEVPEEYQDSASIFEIHGYHYIEKLEKLLIRTEFVKSRYIIMTGSAGNGKTNLLCSLVETLMNSGKLCIFMNSKDVKINLDQYFSQQMAIYNWSGFKIYWSIQMFLCRFLCKKIYIIFDAINENETTEFMESMPCFIDKMLKYPNVRIIVTCRSEYFDLKYRRYLVEKVKHDAYCYDILTEKYSVVAKERIYENYKNFFNFQGETSEEVKDKLYMQLLLMRMFFEVYKGSTLNVISLNKYEIFKNYIDTVMGEEKVECNIFLDKVVTVMCERQEYSEVRLSLINQGNVLSENVKEFMDETILLNRKLILHQNSIREREEEAIYFVFDEMRDYCIAKHILDNMCDSKDLPDEERVIAYMDSLVASNAVCTEGVINYIYWYYKKRGEITVCKKILERFMKPHDQSIEPYRMNREKGLNSWGLRLILENGETLMEYEKEYIKFIVLENPGSELSRLFEFIIQQEMRNGNHTLDLFFDILFNISNGEEFVDVLKETVASWHRDGITTKDFVEIDKKLSEKNYEGCKRFRIYVYLFLHFFDWKDKEKVNAYFDKVYNSNSIKNYLHTRIHFVERGKEDES